MIFITKPITAIEYLTQIWNSYISGKGSIPPSIIILASAELHASYEAELLPCVRWYNNPDYIPADDHSLAFKSAKIFIDEDKQGIALWIGTKDEYSYLTTEKLKDYNESKISDGL